MKLRHFSIRDLLWLFVVVALATGWGVDRFQLEQARRSEQAARQRAMDAARQAEYAQAVSAAAAALQNSRLIKANDVLVDLPKLEAAKASLQPTAFAAEATDGGDDVQRLLRDRLAVLDEIVNLRAAAYEVGAGGIDSLLQARHDVAQAKVELASTREERIAALQERIEAAKAAEERAKAMFEAAQATKVDMLVAKSFRLKAEAELAREKQLQ